MSKFREFASAIALVTVLLLTSATARAGGLEHYQRLRVAGWSMVGVGAVLAGTGTGLIVSVDCIDPACTDDEMFRQNMGIVTISLGVATAVGIGMPMLIRARRLNQSEDSAVNGEAASQGYSRLHLRVGPGSLILHGAF